MFELEYVITAVAKCRLFSLYTKLDIGLILSRNM